MHAVRRDDAGLSGQQSAANAKPVDSPVHAKSVIRQELPGHREDRHTPGDHREEESRGAFGHRGDREENHAGDEEPHGDGPHEQAGKQAPGGHARERLVGRDMPESFEGFGGRRGLHREDLGTQVLGGRLREVPQHDAGSGGPCCLGAQLDQSDDSGNEGRDDVHALEPRELEPAGGPLQDSVIEA